MTSISCIHVVMVTRLAKQNTIINMADETLAKSGLYFDELNKIRVLEPEVAQQTSELKDECKEFVDSKFYPLN